MKEDYIRIRLDAETKAIIEKRAKEENRTMSSYIINLVKEDNKMNSTDKYIVAEVDCGQANDMCLGTFNDLTKAIECAEYFFKGITIEVVDYDSYMDGNYNPIRTIDQERMAMKKAVEWATTSVDDEQLQNCIDNDYVNIHIARNGRKVAWYLDENGDAAVYIDNLEVLDEDEIKEELC